MRDLVTTLYSNASGLRFAAELVDAGSSIEASALRVSASHCDEAAAEIARLRAELAEARKALQLIRSAAEQSSEWPPRRRSASLDGIEKVAIRALKSPKPQEATMSEGVGG